MDGNGAVFSRRIWEVLFDMLTFTQGPKWSDASFAVILGKEFQAEGKAGAKDLRKEQKASMARLSEQG